MYTNLNRQYHIVQNTCGCVVIVLERLTIPMHNSRLHKPAAFTRSVATFTVL